jgi:IS30 family transposase
MVDHKKFTVATDVEVYFCDPKSPLGSGAPARTPTG